MVVALCAGVAMTSCSDDDDDDSDGGSGKSKKTLAIQDLNGDLQLLTKAGDYRFYYDEDGSLEEVTTSYFDWELDKNFNFSDDCSSMKCTRNGSGYITKIVYEEEEDGDYSKQTINFSYNSNGTLSKISYTFEYKETYSDYYDENEALTIKGSGTMTLTCTWEAGNLVKVVGNGKSTASGDAYVTGENGTIYEEINFRYGQQENELAQNVMAIIEPIGGDILTPLHMLGLLGKGTANFPKGYTYLAQWSDEDVDETDSETMSYSVSSNGTVRSETIGGRNYTYSYNTLETRAVSPLSEPVFTAKKAQRRSRGMLDMRRHRR